MKPIRRLAFVINADKAGAPEVARQLIDLAKSVGAETIETTEFPQPDGFLDGCDACCVIGGDGTMLGVAREAARLQVPLLGVNRGSLGFLTTFTADEARAELPGILAGDYRLASRVMLACTIGGGQPDTALNDVLVKDEVNSRLVHLALYADDEFVAEYACDGLIFSTSTGSTAYNLSAGGPLIQPDAGVIAMTPICPHTLSNRTIVFRQEVRLRIENRSAPARMLVALDGRSHLVNDTGASVEIALAPQRLPLIQSRDHAHFDVVRRKLGWSGGFTG